MIWLICIIALVLVILLFPVNITAKYEYSAEKLQNIFTVTFFGIKVFEFDANSKNEAEEKELDSEKKAEKKKFTYEDFKVLSERWGEEKEAVKKNLGKLFRNLKRLANMKEAECRFDFGFGDAAQTGIAAGVAYGLVYNAFAKLYYCFNIKQKDLSVAVNPDFTKERLELYLKFRLGARLIFAFFAAADVVKIYFALIRK